MTVTNRRALAILIGFALLIAAWLTPGVAAQRAPSIPAFHAKVFGSKAWQAQSNAHSIISPRILVYPVVSKGRTGSPAEIRAWIRDIKQGADDLKIIAVATSPTIRRSAPTSARRWCTPVASSG